VCILIDSIQGFFKNKFTVRFLGTRFTHAISGFKPGPQVQEPYMDICLETPLVSASTLIQGKLFQNRPWIFRHLKIFIFYMMPPRVYTTYKSYCLYVGHTVFIPFWMFTYRSSFTVHDYQTRKLGPGMPGKSFKIRYHPLYRIPYFVKRVPVSFGIMPDVFVKIHISKHYTCYKVYVTCPTQILPEKNKTKHEIQRT
jgi:hypothetical protein